MLILRLFCLALLISGTALAETTLFTLVSADPGMVNHWPGQDDHIGTAADYISGSLSSPHESAPNSYGSYCYNAFNFGSGQTDPGIPSPYDAITFIEGSVGIDLVAVGGRIPDAPWITELTVTQGTPPFPSHQPFTAQFTNVAGWTRYGDHGFVMSVDFAASIGGVEDTSSEALVIDGDIWVIEAADYGTPTGFAYLDEVIIPRAQAQSASSLVYMWGVGIIPASTGPSWGPMPMKAVVVAFTDAIATERSSWSEVKTSF